MTNPVQFVEDEGWDQELPTDVAATLQEEADTLSSIIKTEETGINTGTNVGVAGYVGAGGTIYATIQQWISVNGAKAPGVAQNVYDWIVGAADVNNDTGFYGQFIQEYTVDGYTIRYGAGGATAIAKAQLASNQIALNVAKDILRLNALPDAVGLAVSDAGAAAADVFNQAPLPLAGDYAGWAGTLLFPYLSEPQFYEDFLLNPNTLTLPAPENTDLTGNVTYKNVPGTYDLFASIEASLQAGRSAAAGSPGTAFWVYISGPSNITQPDQTSIINETNSFVQAYYALPSSNGFTSAEFLPGNDLIFSAPAGKNIDYVVGTLAGEILDERNNPAGAVPPASPMDQSVPRTIIVGGPGSDVIYGVATGDELIDGGDGNNTIHAGGGNSIIYGGGTGTNILYGNTADTSSATTTGQGTVDILVGGGGDAIAADAVVGITPAVIGQDGADTFYADADSNIMIGGNFRNTFNIDSTQYSTKINVIWGGGGSSVYNFINNGSNQSNVYVVYMNNPTVESITSLDVKNLAATILNSFGTSIPGITNYPASVQNPTIIINPTNQDTISLNGMIINGQGSFFGGSGGIGSPGESINYYFSQDFEQYWSLAPGGLSIEQALPNLNNYDPLVLTGGISIQGIANGDLGINLPSTATAALIENVDNSQEAGMYAIPTGVDTINTSVLAENPPQYITSNGSLISQGSANASGADPGPFLIDGSLTVGQGQTTDITAAVNGFVSPGLQGDTETITGIAAPNGQANLSTTGTLTYTAPTSGSDTLTYTVTDQLGDRSVGLVAVTVDPGPSTGTLSKAVATGTGVNLTNAILGVDSPGLAGDILTLTAYDTTGTLGVVSINSGQLTYAVSATAVQAELSHGVAADHFGYTVADQYGDTASGIVTLTVLGMPSNGNTLTANPAGDTIIVNGNSNQLNGGAGTTILTAYGSENTLVGGAGTSTLTASGDSNLLSGGSGQEHTTIDGGSNSFFAGTGADDLSLTGDDNLFVGGAGTSSVTVAGNGNVLVGGAGQMTFTALSGSGNIYEAGPGYVTVDYSQDPDAVSVDLTDGTASFAHSTGVDQLDYIPEVHIGSNSSILAGAMPVYLVANGDDSTLVGGAGYDSLIATGSGNTLQAGAGGASLSATGNANLLEGGTAYYAVLAAYGDQNTLQGGTGTNTLIVSGDSNVLTSGGGYEEVDVTGNDNSLDAYDSNVSVSLSGDGNLFTGGSNYASVVVDGNGNLVTGGSQYTSITAHSGSGNTYAAGAGYATLDYSQDTQPVNVNLATGTASFVGSSGIDTIEGITQLTIQSNSSILADSSGTNLLINGNGSTLQGGDGFDVLTSNGDDDTLIAGSGGGSLMASGGSNLLEGGSGYAVLTAYGDQNTFQGGTGTDTFVSYGEHNVLTGGGGYENITLYGDDNTLHTEASNTALTVYGDGNDFTGGSDYASVSVSGSDNVFTGGSAATDFKSFGGSGNSFNGGTGRATLDYSGNPLAASVDLAAGTASFAGSSSVDTISNISVLAVGSNSSMVGDSGSDSLYIFGSGSTLQGGSGNDMLTAYGQDDTLTAGSGGGILNANGTNDVYWNNPASASVTLQNNPGTGAPANQLSFASGASTEQLWFTESGNDLQIQALGSAHTTTVQNWFSDPASQLQEINSSDGWQLDTGVSQLVQAVATYDASHPGFDPATASIMPTDSILQGAIAAAWHH